MRGSETRALTHEIAGSRSTNVGNDSSTRPAAAAAPGVAFGGGNGTDLTSTSSSALRDACRPCGNRIAGDARLGVFQRWRLISLGCRQEAAGA